MNYPACDVVVAHKENVSRKKGCYKENMQVAWNWIEAGGAFGWRVEGAWVAVNDALRALVLRAQKSRVEVGAPARELVLLVPNRTLWKYESNEVGQSAKKTLSSDMLRILGGLFRWLAGLVK